MVLELPPYRRPSLRSALTTTLDRAGIFIRKAGTVILAICLILWWLSAYPAVTAPEEAETLRAESLAMETVDPERASGLLAEADRIEGRHALAHSYAGRLGRGLEPVFTPLGYDWQLAIPILTSFAAREVFVSSLAVVLGTHDDVEDPRVVERIRTATRDDGSPLFTRRVSASLLIFYVLAMQCLPTLAVTRREAGGWKWAALQLGAMTMIAYAAAWITTVGLGLLGVQ
jgi:ferrous iron transport protein B